MPTWFYNRPTEQADPTEALVAEVFNRLPGDWYIRWGYFYERRQNAGLRDLEGDFILLGPDGRILVVEVKSGQNRHFVFTGEWEHGEDNPASQLAAEWKAVIFDLNSAYDGGIIPYVGKALCLPHVNMTEQDRLMGEFSREELIFKQDLEDMPGWWQRHLAKHKTLCPDPVKAFHGALAKTLKPASVKLFLKQSDLLFDRLKSTEFEILSMLRGNRQWMVEGGVGTGKTFLAMKQAQWFAEQGEGKEVLFVAYNLLLVNRLQQMVTRLKLKRGRIVVKSWETLVEDIVAIEGIGLTVPEGKAEKIRYYSEELPSYVRMVIEDGRLLPSFDALVVDEAQDHDTKFASGFDAAGLGWWSWYFALLREGRAAQMSIFYDAAQRPAFRGPDGFDADALRAELQQAVHVKLRKSLRYTRPILEYLKTLVAAGTERLCSNLMAHETLPTGLEVQKFQAQPKGIAAAVESILVDWKKKGLCKPTDVVVIGPRKWLDGSSLAEVETLCGFPLRDYSEDVFAAVNYIGAHRSKGMDFLAVILVDFDPFSDLASDSEKQDLQEAFFLGASRARQLLAVVEMGVESRN